MRRCRLQSKHLSCQWLLEMSVVHVLSRFLLARNTPDAQCHCTDSHYERKSAKSDLNNASFVIDYVKRCQSHQTRLNMPSCPATVQPLHRGGMKTSSKKSIHSYFTKGSLHVCMFFIHAADGDNEWQMKHRNMGVQNTQNISNQQTNCSTGNSDFSS